MRPVAAEVLSRYRSATPTPTRRPLWTSACSPARATARHQAAPTVRAETEARQTTNKLPLLVLGGVIVAVLVIVGVVAVSLGNRGGVATLPTDIPSATTLPSDTPQQAAPTEPVLAATTAPNATPVPPTPIPPTQTSVPPSATPVPPTPTAVPPSATPVPPTPILPTLVPGALTPAPAGWLPVRFIWTSDAFYWMNDSSQSISESDCVRAGGRPERFSGSQWAVFYPVVEPGRCMKIMFVDVAVAGCPEGRRHNVLFTPSRTQGFDF
jgi:hypothetical protein